MHVFYFLCFSLQHVEYLELHVYAYVVYGKQGDKFIVGTYFSFKKCHKLLFILLKAMENGLIFKQYVNRTLKFEKHITVTEHL